jgi:hypothetical protein
VSRANPNEKESRVALTRALLPAARALINDGVTAAEVQSAVAQAFVQAAMEVAKLKNGKVNQSKVAIMTGYSRTEIRKVLSGIRDLIEDGRAFGAKRLLDGWSRDPEFSSRTGARKPLPILGNYGSFHSLAKKYSGDIPAKAALDELRRTGLVEVRRNRVLASVQPGGERSRRVAAIGRVSERLVEAFTGVDGAANSGDVASSDLLEFEFDLNSGLAIAEDRVRQSGRAFMNGIAVSLKNIAASPGKLKPSKKAQLRVGLTIIKRPSK